MDFCDTLGHVAPRYRTRVWYQPTYARRGQMERYAAEGYQGCIGRTLDRISVFPDGRAYVCSYLPPLEVIRKARRMRSNTPMDMETIARPLRALDTPDGWDDFDAVEAAARKTFNAMAEDPAVIGAALDGLPQTPELLALCEHYDILDKIVLHDDPAGFRKALDTGGVLAAGCDQIKEVHEAEEQAAARAAQQAREARALAALTTAQQHDDAATRVAALQPCPQCGCQIAVLTTLIPQPALETWRPR